MNIQIKHGCFLGDCDCQQRTSLKLEAEDKVRPGVSWRWLSRGLLTIGPLSILVVYLVR